MAVGGRELFCIILISTLFFIGGNSLATFCPAEPEPESAPTLAVGEFKLNNKQQQKAAVALFVFGDSLYDPGNNNYIKTTTQFQANFVPYGLTFFHYPTGRFSDGRLIPDFIAEYANLPIIPAYLKPGNDDFVYGANFASGGGGALDETYSGLVINLKTQLKYFKLVKNQLKQKLGNKEALHLLSNSVYMLSCGGNDYLSTYGTNSSVFDIYTPQQYVDIVVGNITTFIQEMYNEGARKFGFTAIPPLGCWPNFRDANGDCVENVTALVKLHNTVLSKAIKKLEKKLEGFVYSKFDLYTAISDRMTHPSKYGLENGISACCGSGMYGGVYSCGGKRGVEEYELCKDVSKYLFFDSYHPTEAVYEQIAMLMWSGDSTDIGLNNLNSLFELKQ